jgi:prepilin-type N-terminal cleavage/methylation domain-containing protein
MNSLARKPRRAFSLIEILVVAVILCVLALYLVPKLLGGKKAVPGDSPTAATPIQRARQAAGSEYIGQINQAIQMYRGDHNEQNPPNLEALKSYGVLEQMIKDPNTGQTLPYNPTTGVVSGGNGPEGLGGGTAFPQIGK